jgi:5-methylcytosine-specific restriction protein B
MSLTERRRQFEVASRADPLVGPRTKFHKLFGVSNSAKVIPGGLQLGVVNLDNVASDVDGFAFACTIVFPPADEVYFTAYVKSGTHAMIARLAEMKQRAAEASMPESVAESAGDEAGLSYAARNNNTVVVLADDGSFYLRNQGFWDTLPTDRSTLGAPIPVDRINVALYPPAASAQRSMLAREFIGYLARFIGREKVHEIQVWQDESAVSDAMRRMPATIPIADIRAGIADLGGVYSDALIDRFHAGLNHLADKHFVILPGVSGTGKTLLARQYARAVHGITSLDAPDPLLFICPVRPEWTDPSGLTGYFDVLQNRYVVPPFLEALLVATAYPDAPVFVVLDEMNLARVEYYLADVLSGIESRHPLVLHSSSVPLEGSTGGEIPSRLNLPSNLFLIGTINVDETTNPLSDKVLDRAVVIDMSAVDLPRFFGSLLARSPTLASSIEACSAVLEPLNALLGPHGLGFGYRLADEFVRYHAFATGQLGSGSGQVIDDLLAQKALVRLRGGEAQRDMLLKLTALLKGHPQASVVLARLTMELEEIGTFQNAR